MMPYPMHPLLYGADLESRMEACRQQKRTMRIFFSGDTEGYRKNRIHYPTTKLTRSETVDAIMEKMGDKLVCVNDAVTHNRLLEGDYTRKFVIANNSHSGSMPVTGWSRSQSQTSSCVLQGMLCQCATT